ncbi:low-affinity gluconate transporter [Salmonella enterica subsp. enterica]|uniref:Low-affinity gluconate transporter n=1 Tax=Salmonella enterica I TaxID=59201 RepID=A0A379W0P5_SALET|nr:low-affinity gluconate transporter [Salmonella enterica subsp. enterica]
MFGKILHETGAVDQIAVKMLKSFGHNRAHYAIGLAGLICALPLFFEVAIVLLISVAFSMARHTGTNLVKLVIPLFAGVAAAAAFLLPGPAPMLLASQMHADFGWMILIGLCAAIPGMIIAGPLWGILSAVMLSCVFLTTLPSRIWVKVKCLLSASACR